MKFTPEHRGETWHSEWCVIDEEEGFIGFAVLHNLTEQQAKIIANLLNQYEENNKKAGWIK